MAEWLANARRMPEPTAEGEPATVNEIAVAYTKHVEARYQPGKVTTVKSAIRVVRER